MKNFKTLRQALLGELAMSWKERGEREKMPFIVATYVYASSQGQRTQSTRTKSNKIGYPERCHNQLFLILKGVAKNTRCFEFYNFGLCFLKENDRLAGAELCQAQAQLG
jgi:hypothetical protein